MIKMIVKRDGRKVSYNIDKIKDAIFMAATVVNLDVKSCETIADKITKIVDSELNTNYTNRKCPTVEQVQDIVEKSLILDGQTAIAKEYILYRAERNKNREMKADLMQIFNDLTFQDSKDLDLKRENANIDADTAMGTMLKYGSEAAKEFNHLYLLEKEASDAHISGDIHIHDLDFAGIGTLTCVQSPLDKIFKGGFSTGHGYLREPESIRSYSALTAIVLQCSQNEMHGGQSIPALDYYLTPGVAKTYISEICKVLDSKFDLEEEKRKEIKSELRSHLEECNYHLISDSGNCLIENILKKYAYTSDEIKGVREKALKHTEKETYQAMEALVHNLNSMHSRAGAQVSNVA